MNKYSFASEGSDELDSRFRGTFISIKSKNLRVPVYVEQLNVKGRSNGEYNITLSGSTVDVNTMDWRPLLKTYPESSLDYYIPVPGMRNFTKCAAWFDIYALRHRYRGMTKNQIALTPLVGEEDKWVYDNLSAEVMYGIFNPKIFSLEEAVELIRRKKRGSVAFSPNLALHKMKGFRRCLVNYKGLPVGLYSIKHKSFVLPKTGVHLLEEISAHGPVVTDSNIKG